MESRYSENECLKEGMDTVTLIGGQVGQVPNETLIFIGERVLMAIEDSREQEELGERNPFSRAFTLEELDELLGRHGWYDMTPSRVGRGYLYGDGLWSYGGNIELTITDWS